MPLLVYLLLAAAVVCLQAAALDLQQEPKVHDSYHQCPSGLLLELPAADRRLVALL